MKYFLISLCLLFSLTLSAQILFLDQNKIDSFPCPQDSSEILYTYKDWKIYQTIDNTWEGATDNSSCLTLKKENANSGRYGIDLSSINTAKPLFIAYVGAPIELDKDQVYSFQSSVSKPNGVTFKYGTDCTEEICSGLMLFTEHSDPQYTDTLFCESKLPYLENSFDQINTCLPTEKTASNRIIKVVTKLSFDSSGDGIQYLYLYFQEHYDSVRPIKENIVVNESFFDGTNYNARLAELIGFNNSYLVTHNTNGLPSPTNQSYIEFLPEINKTTPTPININLNWDLLYFQKYSHLIGGLVEGSDSLRHPLNLMIGSEMCLFLIDAIGGSRTSFIISDGGSINFADTKSCLQIRDNSSLIIAQNQTAHLGNYGVGNVNLRSGGNIILEENAELVFDGTMILTPYKPYTGNKPIHVDLKKGSKLSFTMNAQINNNMFGDELLLYVYMNGGTLDRSKLSKEDHSKIILVYPTDIQTNKQLKLLNSAFKLH